MLTVGTRIRVVAFVVIALLVVAFIANKYADLGRYVGVRDYYTVRLELPNTGGLFKGSAVSYRGVTVGRVGSLELTNDGVIADLRVNKSAPKIPRDNLQAIVANRSAVGEQYVDLRPAGPAGPYLAQGNTIAQSQAQVPPPVTETLSKVNGLTASIPLAELQIVIDELGLAFTGQGPNLQHLIDTSDRFLKASEENFPTTQALIDNGAAVLRTQNEEAAAFRAFARNARLFAQAVRGADSDIRRSISAGTQAADEFARLVDDLDPTFGVLLANLLTVTRLTGPRQPGLEELLVKLPQVIAAGSTAVSGGKANFGLVNTFFNPQPCTRGYGSTNYRNGLLELSGAPFNTRARCTEPASSGINVRGTANAPRAGVPAAVRPESAIAPGGATNEVLGALGLPELGGSGQSDLQTLLGLAGAAP